MIQPFFHGLLVALLLGWNRLVPFPCDPVTWVRWRRYGGCA